MLHHTFALRGVWLHELGRLRFVGGRLLIEFVHREVFKLLAYVIHLVLLGSSGMSISPLSLICLVLIKFYWGGRSSSMVICGSSVSDKVIYHLVICSD